MSSSVAERSGSPAHVIERVSSIPSRKHSSFVVRTHSEALQGTIAYQRLIYETRAEAALSRGTCERFRLSTHVINAARAQLSPQGTP